MADNPDIQWALNILTPDPDYKPSLFTEYGVIVGTSFSMFFGGCIRNKISHRPAFAGIQVHIGAAIVGFIGAYMFKNMMDNYFAKRDQMLKHYITLHPEDFPQPVRKKWSEVLEPWYPIRN